MSVVDDDDGGFASFDDEDSEKETIAGGNCGGGDGGDNNGDGGGDAVFHTAVKKSYFSSFAEGSLTGSFDSADNSLQDFYSLDNEDDEEEAERLAGTNECDQLQESDESTEGLVLARLLHEAKSFNYSGYSDDDNGALGATSSSTGDWTEVNSGISRPDSPGFYCGSVVEGKGSEVKSGEEEETVLSGMPMASESVGGNQSLLPSDSDDFSAVSAVGDANALVFEIGAMDQEQPIPIPPRMDQQYSSIRFDNVAGSRIMPLNFVQRVAFYRDRKYTLMFLIVLGVFAVVGISMLNTVDNKHHYLLSLTTALILSGVINAVLLAAHYRLLSPRGLLGVLLSEPFSLERLVLVLPVEAFALGCVTLAVWVEGWSVLLGLLPLCVAFFDYSRIAATAENLDFAAVVLNMASELVIVDSQLKPIIRRTWITFLLHNVWLVLWAGVFVDAASVDQTHISFATVTFLFFLLFWSSQVARSLISFYVTGAVCYRLALTDQHELDANAPADVETRDPELQFEFDEISMQQHDRQQDTSEDAAKMQDVLFKRGLTVCFGTVCAGGLMIGPISILWGVMEAVHAIVNRSARMNNNTANMPTHAQVQTIDEHDAELDSVESSSLAHGDNNANDNNNARMQQQRRSSIVALVASRDPATLWCQQGSVNSKFISHANRYGWARASLRGSKFVTSSREAWDLMVARGVHGVLDKDLAESLLRSWAWVIGSLTALTSLLLLPAVTHATSDILFLYFLASFAMGAANAALLLEPLRAAVAGIFVAYSEQQHCLAKYYPIVDHRFARLCEMALLRR